MKLIYNFWEKVVFGKVMTKKKLFEEKVIFEKAEF